MINKTTFQLPGLRVIALGILLIQNTSQQICTSSRQIFSVLGIFQGGNYTDNLSETFTTNYLNLTSFDIDSMSIFDDVAAERIAFFICDISAATPTRVWQPSNLVSGLDEIFIFSIHFCGNFLHYCKKRPAGYTLMLNLEALVAKIYK